VSLKSFAERWPAPWSAFGDANGVRRTGERNTGPGFSELLAFVCDECQVLVKLSDDPNLDRLFG
jgi:hypothetical protein